MHNLYDRAVLDCWVTGYGWLRGKGLGLGLGLGLVVNLVILLNSKTMEVLTQHLLAFLRPSKSI